MDNDLIKEVKNVEQEAEKIIRDAEEKGQNTLTEITEQAKKLIKIGRAHV
jgi:vacuolar-type H+-ATPase subunit H